MENTQTIILSIIVPIYNIAPYIEKCVESLLSQDLAADSYEIILVDDGSDDGSGELIDRFALLHTNVKVLHQANQGVSVARNKALAVAQGRYVEFVDGDDYLKANVLGLLLGYMENEQLDVLRFNYRWVNEKGESIKPYKYATFDVYDGTVSDGLTFMNQSLGIGCYPWQFIFRREYVHILFEQGIMLAEDTDWTIRLMLEAQRVKSVDVCAYNYLVRVGGATLAVLPEKKLKKIEDQIWIIGRMQEVQKRVGKQPWFEGQIAATALSVLTAVAMNFYEDRKRYISRLRELKVFPLSSRHLTPAARRKRLIANFSPEIYCFLLHQKK